MSFLISQILFWALVFFAGIGVTLAFPAVLYQTVRTFRPTMTGTSALTAATRGAIALADLLWTDYDHNTHQLTPRIPNIGEQPESSL
jgi:hypothetical protein